MQERRNLMMLKDRVALITGAASGIGAGTAELFAQQGANVFAIDRNRAGAEARMAAIRDTGGSAFAFEADVRKPDMLRHATEEALNRFGRIDIVINNAGIYPRQSFLDITGQQWDEMQDVNLKGMFHLCQLALPHMMKRRSGKIVNISSVTFFFGPKNLTHYVASKGGVIGFTRSLAREMGEHNIHINCITPGAVETEGEKSLNPPQEVIEQIVGQQSLKRRIVPLDIARACLFLSSELSDGITGQTLNVDGGWINY
jgi:3-oxoacyl-[acyl-carrier protein] reductase